jgi:HTH-type transcriptional regulator/antitoxin HigA
MNAPVDMQHLLPAWEQFRAATDISTIRDETHYARMTQILESLLDEAGVMNVIPSWGLWTSLATS